MALNSRGPADWAYVESLHQQIDPVRQFLSENRWPVGLQNTLLNNLGDVPKRFFICDDSASMITGDGKRFGVTSTGKLRALSCTRWSELGASIQFLAQLASLARAPSEFRFLNRDETIIIGEGAGDNSAQLQALRSVFSRSPSGETPLCCHVRAVVDQIRRMAPELRRDGKKVVVVVASDGISTDGDVASALQPLRDLPAWLVIRLCTDDKKIVNYWNSVDSELEVNMDVLDDLSGEAKEVSQNNPWLTYAEPLHRIREFGLLVREFDLLDESKLALDQVRHFCALLFGGHEEDFPHPELDWLEFQRAVERGMHDSPQVYCPLTKVVQPWISLPSVQAMCDDG